MAILLPFALNDSTRFISPTKIPEYLAGGKPVVSTPIRDVINPYGKQKLVSIAENADEFVAAVETILQTKKEDFSSWLKNVDQQLSQNSWDYTWKRRMTLIESSMAATNVTDVRHEKDDQYDKDEENRTIVKQPEASIPRIPVYMELEKKERKETVMEAAQARCNPLII